MRAYSNEFRERVIRASERGEAVQSIAERLEVSFGWVYSLLRRYRKTGNYKALSPHNAGVKPKLSQTDLERLRQTVLSNPDATLEELKKLTNFPVSISTLSRVLNNRLKMPVKKKRFMPRSKIDRMLSRPERSGMRKRSRRGIP